MGYISLPSGAVQSFGKAIISLWFRVPQVSLDAAAAAYVPPHIVSPPANFSIPPPLNGIIPLIVFGKRYDSHLVYISPQSVPYTLQSVLMTSAAFCTPELLSSIATDQSYAFSVLSDKFLSDPSYIGIDCSPPSSEDQPAYRLAVRLQTGDSPTMVGTLFGQVTPPMVPSIVTDLFASSYVFDSMGDLCSNVVQKNDNSGHAQFVLNTPKVFNFTYTDQSDLQANAQPEYFGGTSPTIPIVPGAWHHLLISFDLEGTMTAESPFDTNAPPAGPWMSDARMWLAVNDTNYNGADLPSVPYPDNTVPSDPNTILSLRMLNVTETGQAPATNFDGAEGAWHWEQDNYSGGPSGPGTYSLTLESGAIEANAGPVAMPASADLVDNIYDVDMAELQMWTEKTLDTSVTANRRLFITSKGTLESISTASKELGRPAVLVHGTGSWISGKNTGTTGQDDMGKIILSGQFQPSGTIIQFKPDPKVTGQPVKPTNPKSKG